MAALVCGLIALVWMGAWAPRSLPEQPEAEPGPAFFSGAWRHILVDDQRAKWGDFDQPEWLRYFGLAVGDLTGDSLSDIASGRYFYRNPGGDLSARWERINLGLNLDAILITDVDGDDHGDLIAQALPDIYWVESLDTQGNTWRARKVAVAPPTGHVNSQGFATGQLVPGGRPEIVLATGEGILYLEIPPNPTLTPWPSTRVTEDASDEGIAISDIDGDGLVDLIAANGPRVAWWRNPGAAGDAWGRQEIGTTGSHDIDRIAAADIDGDGRTDVVVTQEVLAGDEPEADLFWFRQAAESGTGLWSRQRLMTAYSLNSLDAADMDGDGDIDLVVGEHKGPYLRLLLLENHGGGRFLVREIDRGKESHLGARTADLDGDGDFDLISIAWDRYQDLHLWRNDRAKAPRRLCWRQVSNHAGDFAKADVGAQSSAVVFDVDRDGRDDVIIAGWDPQISMVWFRSTDAGLERYLIDSRQSHIEAGGAAFDIDGDGDLDLVQGGSWKTNELWWWENPHPDHDPDRSWSPTPTMTQIGPGSGTPLRTAAVISTTTRSSGTSTATAPGSSHSGTSRRAPCSSPTYRVPRGIPGPGTWCPSGPGDLGPAARVWPGPISTSMARRTWSAAGTGSSTVGARSSKPRPWTPTTASHARRRATLSRADAQRSCSPPATAEAR